MEVRDLHWRQHVQIHKVVNESQELQVNELPDGHFKEMESFCPDVGGHAACHMRMPSARL